MLIIDKLLEEKGMSKTELAKKLGKSKSTISGYLSNPNLSTLEAIASALDVSVRDLFQDSKIDQNFQELFTKDENGNLKSVGFIKK